MAIYLSANTFSGYKNTSKSQLIISPTFGGHFKSGYCLENLILPAQEQVFLL